MASKEAPVDDGRQGPDKKKGTRPSWAAERSVPERPAPGSNTRPLSLDDLSDLVPASDPVVREAYGRSGALPMRPNMNRGEGNTDALVIRRGARETRVMNFEVEGVHWRAGFAPSLDKTPLYQYLPSPIPPDHEVRTGNGFVLRPVESELEAVLRDLVPPALLMTGDHMFGPLRELGGVYLYYVPQGKGAAVGMIAWYLPSPTTKAHLLYLQTEVRKGSDKLIDDMHRTFQASLAARTEHGGSRRPMDFWSELQLATAQVGATLRTSKLSQGGAEVKGKISQVRDRAETRTFDAVNTGLAAAGVALESLFVKLPQQVLVRVIHLGSQALIAGIRTVDRLLTPKAPRE